MTTFGIATFIFSAVALMLPYRKEGDELPQLALWICAGILLLLSFVAWLCLRFTRWLYSNGIPAVATITRVSDILVGNHHRYRHFYETTIVFVANGKRIESSWRVATKHEPRVGADLVVFFDPKYPEVFVVAPDAEAEEWKVNRPA